MNYVMVRFTLKKSHLTANTFIACGYYFPWLVEMFSEVTSSMVEFELFHVVARADDSRGSTAVVLPLHYWKLALSLPTTREMPLVLVPLWWWHYSISPLH